MAHVIARHADHHGFGAHSGEHISRLVHGGQLWVLVALAVAVVLILLYAAWANAVAPENTMDPSYYYFRYW